MASSSTKSVQKLLQNSTILKRGAEYARQEIFGHVPILEGASTGTKTAKKAFTGPYIEKYYPVSINTYARKIHGSGWETEYEERKRIKLVQRRRKGKGPPKKGAGARSGKKKK
ncbi:hypothetical protein FRACYDRAFT_260581 [Fragilariopsis cylindrus CCMP1102]|uniref:Small ribosomal subunit protein mS33 n=1 Tax=Fragilariopsis cylindrus CCMP1102 TaxID=635003 RepID=A0A1E7FL42_9STRA|nr:hypothetical protein FRACYDRAFT_260581 [Fragilariopsis cylindrus CCMP1102]|eukprot:OEU18847.1 hypothetical protein FRACYDRAFT_260581 [Fragilariopsis cylindrus CCMP1102]